MEQNHTPYVDALLEYARRNPARLHVPGHKGGQGADPGLLEAIGEQALRMDIPALTHGIDVGVDPTPFELAQRLAADAWGARRAWFLINGASQGNLAAGLALAHLGSEVVVQRNAHSSTIDSLVMSGMRPTFAAPEVDAELGVAHCLTPETLDTALARTPGAVGAWVISPTYFGAVADIRSLAEVAHSHDVPLIVDEAWGAHMAFHERLPEHALSAGADLVISSTHKIVGSLTQSAMLHLGHGAAQRIGEDMVDRAVTLTESTSPNSLLFASLDAARRQAAVHGRELLEYTMGHSPPPARKSVRSRGWTYWTIASPDGPASSPTTRCAWPSTCAGSRRAATSRAHAPGERRHQPRALRTERPRGGVRDGRAPPPGGGPPGGGSAGGRRTCRPRTRRRSVELRHGAAVG